METILNPVLKFVPSGRWDAPAALPLAVRWPSLLESLP